MSSMAIGATKSVLNVALEACKTEADKFAFMPMVARTIVFHYALVASRECWVGTYGREDLATPLSYGMTAMICEHFREVVRMTQEICGNDFISDTYRVNLVEMSSFANHLCNVQGSTNNLMQFSAIEYAPLYTSLSIFVREFTVNLVSKQKIRKVVVSFRVITFLFEKLGSQPVTYINKLSSLA